MSSGSHMLDGVRRWFTLGVAAFLLAPGCSDSTPEKRRVAQLSEGCTLDSDCASPLVCVFQRCHEECAQTRDCPPGQRCVKGERDLNVCLLPNESECTTDNGCLGELTCATDWQCRDRCDAEDDCIGPQVCATSEVCAEPDEVDGEGSLHPPDASAGGTDSGGSGGSGALGGSSGADGGTGGDGGSSGEATGGSGGGAGTGGSGGSGASGGAGTGGSGGSGASGGGGSGGSGGDCPTGTAECDDEPSTVCEADVTLVTRCGDCSTSCNGANGTVTCDEGECVMLACHLGYGDCDDDPSTGCEVRFANNPAHCGSCFRDCAALGTTCDVDRCDSPTVHLNLPIGSGNSNSLTWAYGGGAFFSLGFNSYTLRKVPVDGSAMSTFWSASAVGGRFSLIANDTEVIWAERGTPSRVLRKPHTALPEDAPDVLFTPEYQPYFLRVHDDAYFWMSGDYQSGDPGGYIYTRAINAPADDPGARIVSDSQGTHGEVTAFITSSNALYWYTTDTNPAELRTAPLAGGTPSVVPVGTIASGSANNRVTLRSVGNTLYYNREVGDTFTNGIYRWAPGDPAPTQLVVAENVSDFLVDANAIYFVGTSSRRVKKAPLAGGSAVEITDVNATIFLHQDAQAVYVANLGSSTASIYRVLK